MATEPRPPIDHVWGQLALALIALLGIIVLTAMHITPPAVLDVIAGGTLGGAAALSQRRSGG